MIAPGDEPGIEPDEQRYHVLNLLDRHSSIIKASLAKLPSLKMAVATTSNSIRVMPLPFGKDSFLAIKMICCMLDGMNLLKFWCFQKLVK